MEGPAPKYTRLCPGNEVRLKGAYLVTCTGCVKDADGNVTEILCEYDPDSRGGDPADGRKVKGATIHWVDAATASDAEVRVYDYLFSDPDPDGPGKDFIEALNPDSLTVLTGCKVEAALQNISMPENGKDSESFQFMRQGYFCLDNRDASPDHLVFNRAVALKDSFKR
jgi:glutaminyl-tRNA synthetase